MADDLFGTWLPAIWTKAQPEGRPPLFMLHRFLASDPDLAQAARELQNVRDPEVAYRIWQGLLPKGPGAPRLSYVAAKRPPAVEALAAQIMRAEAVRREVAEDMAALLEVCGKLEDACAYYGVESVASERGAT